MREHRQLLKSASLISALTLISRVFGYIRDSRIAFLLGAGTAADAYVAAYRIPNLLRRLVGASSGEDAKHRNMPPPAGFRHHGVAGASRFAALLWSRSACA